MNTQQREFDRLVIDYEQEHVKLPTKRQIEKKSAQLSKLASQPMTEVCTVFLVATRASLSCPL